MIERRRSFPRAPILFIETPSVSPSTRPSGLVLRHPSPNGTDRAAGIQRGEKKRPRGDPEAANRRRLSPGRRGYFAACFRLFTSPETLATACVDCSMLMVRISPLAALIASLRSVSYTHLTL